VVYRKQLRHHSAVIVALLLALAMILGACTDNSAPPAPVNSEPTLQKLATAYNEVKAELPVSPGGLNPKGKRKFVEKVFAQAGFDYAKTLSALGQTAPEHRTQHFKDLKQLALMPSNGLAKDQWSEVFSQEEITAIQNMEN